MIPTKKCGSVGFNMSVTRRIGVNLFIYATSFMDLPKNWRLFCTLLIKKSYFLNFMCPTVFSFIFAKLQRIDREAEKRLNSWQFRSQSYKKTTVLWKTTFYTCVWVENFRMYYDDFFQLDLYAGQQLWTEFSNINTFLPHLSFMVSKIVILKIELSDTLGHYFLDSTYTWIDLYVSICAW